MKHTFILLLLFWAVAASAHAEITRGDIAALGSSSTVMTINRSGIYPLTSNYTGQILISASNVTLDMQGFMITGGTYGVRITGNNCTVQNGVITGAQVGVRIESNNNDIINLDLVANGTGLQIISGNNNVVDNCRALQNTSAGFSLSTAQNNMFVNCSAIGNGSNAYAYGFISQSGVGNTFENCIAENTATTGSSPFYAAGFVLTGTEQKSNVLNSIALNASGTSNYGMLISGTVAQYNVLKDNQISGNVIGVRDDYAFTSSASTNLWMENLGNNNTTNFNIGSQYPISAASGTGVGQTENMNAALTTGGPAEKIKATIVDRVLATSLTNVVNYGPTAITGSTTLSSDNSYYLPQTLTSGVITITGVNYVTVDLNGNAIKNIVVAYSNFIIIRNGTVYPNSSTTDGVSILNSGNILLDSLDMISCRTGLVVNSSSTSSDTSLMVRNCNFYTNSGYGVGILAPTKDYYLYNCFASNNAYSGFYTTGSNGILLQCFASLNFTSVASLLGVYYVLGSALGNVLRECGHEGDSTAGNYAFSLVAGNVGAACYSRGSNNQWLGGFAETNASTGSIKYWANTKS